MERGGDIRSAAVPLAAAVAAGEALTGRLSPRLALIFASLSLMAAALLLYASIRRSSHLRWMMVFAFLGLFCSLSHSLFPPSVQNATGLAYRAFEAFKTLINSIPFHRAGTGALAKALLTGDRSSLDRATILAFRGSGASHILALSGLHLGIIYTLVSRVLSLAGNSPAMRRIRSAIVIALSLFYTMMTGAGPSIVRAFIYICLSELCALDPSRRKDPVRILAASLTLQLCLNPSIISSLGFQLSYLAMTGVSTIYPRLRAWWREAEGYPIMHKIWNGAALSIACQAFTAPLVWIRFRTFPSYFLITNIIVLPLSSVFISVSLFTAALSALGICPQALILLSDALAGAMCFLMETISSM